MTLFYYLNIIVGTYTSYTWKSESTSFIIYQPNLFKNLRNVRRWTGWNRAITSSNPNGFFVNFFCAEYATRSHVSSAWGWDFPIFTVASVHCTLIISYIAFFIIFFAGLYKAVKFMADCYSLQTWSRRSSCWSLFRSVPERLNWGKCS